MLTINSNKRSQNAPAFTIVELLIVIVVIAILATITIVAYNGIQARARASAASQALSQAKKKLELYKVDTATYPTTGNLSAAGITNTDTTYQYTSDGSTYCLTGTNSSAIYKVTDATSPTSGGCSGHTWQGGVAMTNVVTNGDFSQGTTGWARENANTLAVVNGKIRLSDPSTYATIRILQFHTLVQGHTYYVRVDGIAKQSVSMSSFEIQYYDLPLSKSVFAANLSATTTSYSSEFVVDTTVSATTRFTVIGNGMTIGSSDYIEFDTALVLDLTTTFGSGSEPTKAQMDAIMQQFPDNWFSGTVTADTRGIL